MIASLQPLELAGFLLASVGVLYVGLLSLGDVRRLVEGRAAENMLRRAFALELSTRRLAFELARDRAQSAWVGYRKFRVAEVIDEDEAGTIRSFRLEPRDDKPLPAFRPGQFLSFRIVVPEHGEQVRCYSISSYDRSRGYRISIKRVPGGRVSNAFHDGIQAGDIVDVGAPSGDFWLDTAEHSPVALFAGGIGITPLLTMVEAATTHTPERPVHLFYGIRCGAELARASDLEELAERHPAVSVTFCYSRPSVRDRKRIADKSGNPRVRHVRGRIGVQPETREGIVDVTETLDEGVRGYQFYLCGPSAMIHDTVSGLRRWGATEDQIHLEEFGPASLPAGEGEACEPALVTFATSDRSVAWDGDAPTLYDLAVRNGIRIKAGCRAGSCGTCKTRVLSGKVRYLKVPGHRVESGSCLPCVAVPEGPVTLRA